MLIFIFPFLSLGKPGEPASAHRNRSDRRRFSELDISIRLLSILDTKVDFRDISDFWSVVMS
jgi:hypothetical protein